jgi:hypothetical protein
MVLALKGQCPGYERKKCRFNPLKKCTYVKCGSDAFKKASALSVTTFYYKILDNINDTKGIKGWIYRLIKPVAKRWNKKAERNFPYICNAVKEMSEGQFRAELDPNSSLDMVAEPTAKMLSKILSYEGENETDKRILENLGYNLGRWIYLMDASDDYDEDIEKGSYNPFKAYSDEKNIKEYCNQVLNQCLWQAYNSWNLLDVKLYRGIIENILLKGLALKQKEVLFTEEQNGNKSL